VHGSNHFAIAIGVHLDSGLAQMRPAGLERPWVILGRDPVGPNGKTSVLYHDGELIAKGAPRCDSAAPVTKATITPADWSVDRGVERLLGRRVPLRHADMGAEAC